MLAALEFLEDDVFWSAVGLGLASTVLVGVAALRSRRVRSTRSPLPLAGIALVAPTVIIVSDRFSLPVGVLGGLLVLGCAGILMDMRDADPAGAVLLGSVGGYLLAWHGDLVPVTWIRIVVVGTSVAGGMAFASFDRRWGGSGYPPAFFALTATGVYFTVPDPYDAIVLFGCALPVTLLGWPLPLARFGANGAFMAAGLLAWTAARDGFGRQSSIIGGVACLGLLLLEPIARLRHRERSALDALPRGRDRWPLALGAQLVLVAVASRVAGLQSPEPYVAGSPLWRGAVAPAVAIVVAEAVTALLVMEVLSRRRPAASRRRPRR